MYSRITDSATGPSILGVHSDKRPFDSGLRVSLMYLYRISNDKLNFKVE